MNEFKADEEFMKKLKVGDLVRLKGKPSSNYRGIYRVGNTSTVAEINPNGYPSVRLAGDRNHPSVWLANVDLELVCYKYPNPPLPWCEERIAFAKGANIEFEDMCGTHNKWVFTDDPEWHTNTKYRVKVEKTKEDLRIEYLQKMILNSEHHINAYKKELAELNPSIPY
jgi:hypothetical protein